MNFKRYIYMILIFIPVATASQNYTNLNTLQWIIGEWQTESKKNITKETWVKLSANTFDGLAQTISKEDDKITFVETLRLVEMSDEIFYLVKVSHNQYPVSFKLTSCSDSTAVFENTDHDFPKKINYQLVNKGQSLDVTVSNEQRHFTVHYRKLSKN